jgi:hypothetical protein
MRATSRRRSSAAFAAGLLLPYHGFPRASRATFLLVGADTLASFECLDKISSSLRRGSRFALKHKLHGSLIIALENVLAFEVHDFAVLTSLSSVAGDFSAPSRCPRLLWYSLLKSRCLHWSHQLECVGRQR